MYTMVMYVILHKHGSVAIHSWKQSITIEVDWESDYFVNVAM